LLESVLLDGKGRNSMCPENRRSGSASIAKETVGTRSLPSAWGMTRSSENLSCVSGERLLLPKASISLDTSVVNYSIPRQKMGETMSGSHCQFCQPLQARTGNQCKTLNDSSSSRMRAIPSKAFEEKQKTRSRFVIQEKVEKKNSKLRRPL
jgi:hypothetical protein